MSNAGERATQASAQRRREHFSTDSLTPEMTETADTYFGFGNKLHLGDWQRRHSLFFLRRHAQTWQTLGRHLADTRRHAQTRADLADTRRHAQTRADTRRHLTDNTWQTRRRLEAHLADTEEGRHATRRRSEAHLADKHLADKAQTRGTPGRQGAD